MVPSCATTALVHRLWFCHEANKRAAVQTTLRNRGFAVRRVRPRTDGNSFLRGRLAVSRILSGLLAGMFSIGGGAVDIEFLRGWVVAVPRGTRIVPENGELLTGDVFSLV